MTSNYKKHYKSKSYYLLKTEEKDLLKIYEEFTLDTKEQKLEQMIYNLSNEDWSFTKEDLKDIIHSEVYIMVIYNDWEKWTSNFKEFRELFKLATKNILGGLN